MNQNPVLSRMFILFALLRAYDVGKEIEILESLGCLNSRDEKWLKSLEEKLKIDTNVHFNENFYEPREEVMEDGSLVLIYKLDPFYEQVNQSQLAYLKKLVSGVRKIEKVDNEYFNLGVQQMMGCYFRRKKHMGMFGQNFFSRFYVKVTNYDEKYTNWCKGREATYDIAKQLIGIMGKLQDLGFKFFNLRLEDILLTKTKNKDRFKVMISFTKLKFVTTDSLLQVLPEISKVIKEDAMFYHPRFVESCFVGKCDVNYLDTLNDNWNIGALISIPAQLDMRNFIQSLNCPGIFVDERCISNMLRKQSYSFDRTESRITQLLKYLFRFDLPTPLSEVVKNTERGYF